MINIIAETENGTQTELNSSSLFTLAAVRGINPPSANIFTEEYAVTDGAVFNSSRLSSRNVVLTIYPNNAAVESGRLAVYAIFRPKKYIKLYFETGQRSVWATGYVEKVEVDHGENPQKMQISILCPGSYLYGTEQTVTLDGSDVSNGGELEVGAVYTLTASGAVSAPVITNSTNSESITIDYELVSGDVLTIDTRIGQKGVSLLRSGTTYNLLNYMSGDWLKLESGDNTLSVTATSGSSNLTTTVTFTPVFEGV